MKSGHDQVAAGGVQDDEEGDAAERGGDDGFLHALRLLRLRRLRRPISGESPHRVRILQPVLAPRHRQCRHRHPPCRSLPSLLPAVIRLCRKIGPRMVPEQQDDHEGDHSAYPGIPIQDHRFPADLEKHICGDHHHHLHAHALLQRRRRDPRGVRVLAVDGLLPGGDVHCADQDSQVEF